VRKNIIIISIVLLLIIAGVYVYKKTSALKKIEVQGISGSIKLDNIKDVYTIVQGFLTNGIKANCSAEIYNFSNSTFNIDSIKIDLYNGDVPISTQTEIVSNITIKPGMNKIEIPVLINTIGVRSLNITYLTILDILQSFYTTGKINKTLTAKGYVVYSGITINLNENITI